MTTNNKVPNRLAKENSPYLLQHAYNPVDLVSLGEGGFPESGDGNETHLFKPWVLALTKIAKR